MTRTEVRSRALRAAMAVTLGTAMLGCGTTVTDPGGHGDGGAPAAGGGGASASIDPSASTSTAGGSGLGGSDAAGGGGAAQASTSSGGTAATKCGPLRTHWKAYEKCCDAVNWDYAQGCEAWGPPMPPSIDWVAQGVV